MSKTFCLVLILISATKPTTIDCPAVNQCNSAEMSCQSGEECLIKCDGSGSCNSAQIDASDATTLTVYCRNNNACNSIIIKCPSVGECNLYCEGNGYCESAWLKCQTSNCNLYCQYSNACSDVLYNIRNAKAFWCHGDYCGAISSDNFSPLPTKTPSFEPTYNPSYPTTKPTTAPTIEPSINPSSAPTIPTIAPTTNPSPAPTTNPSPGPTTNPSSSPTNPSLAPTNPTIAPTTNPTIEPTLQPIDQHDLHELQSENIGSYLSSHSNYVLMFAVCMVFGMIIIFGLYHAKNNQYEFHYGNIVWFAYHILDCLTDIGFVLLLFDDEYWISFVVGLILIFLSSFLSVFQLNRNIKQWLMDPAESNSIWFQDYTGFLYLICFISGSAQCSMLLVTSNWMKYSRFSLQLSKYYVMKLHNEHLVSSVLCENIGQLILQIAYIIRSHKFSDITVLAMIFSGGSILMAPFVYVTRRQLILEQEMKSAKQYQLLE